MQKDYETIFLGCSAYAVGAVQAAPQGSLILEAGEGIGGEFVDTLMTGGFLRPQTPGAQAFYDELVARRALSEESARRGEIHLPGVGVVLTRLLRQSRAHVLFRTRVLRVTRREGGFTVQAVCNAKLYEFTCRHLVDTRSDDFERIRSLDPGARFFLCANVGLSAPIEEPWEGMRIQKGFLPGEYFLRMEVPAPAPGDRERFLSRFDARPRPFLPVRLLLLCHAYGVKSRRIGLEEEGQYYLPGCGYENPVDAFAAGESDWGRAHG